MYRKHIFYDKINYLLFNINKELKTFVNNLKILY